MTPILDGVRVFDLSIVTAGAGCTQVLADHGAEVFKIESVDRPDLFRGWFNTTSGAGDLVSAPFRTIGRNKKGVAIDLKDPDGLQVARELIATCDVVVENFRQGVLGRLGLGFEQLVEIKPDIVLVSVSSQGTTGPDSRYGSFGSPIDALGGSMSVTGYDEQTPLWSSMQVNYPDQTASLLGPALITLGILEARATGRPRWIDISQRELVTALLPEEVLHRSLGGADPVPRRNESGVGHEWVTPCAGQDEWVAVSATRPADRATLGSLLGDPGLADADDESLSKAVAQWSQTRTRAEAAELLQAAGVAAEPVMRGYELLEDPYFQEIGWFVPVDRPDGTGPDIQRGFVVRFDDVAGGRIVRRAPHIGEHTREVLVDLGRSAEQIARLHESGAVFSPSV